MRVETDTSNAELLRKGMSAIGEHMLDHAESMEIHINEDGQVGTFQIIPTRELIDNWGDFLRQHGTGTDHVYECCSRCVAIIYATGAELVICD